MSADIGSRPSGSTFDDVASQTEAWIVPTGGDEYNGSVFWKD